MALKTSSKHYCSQTHREDVLTDLIHLVVSQSTELRYECFAAMNIESETNPKCSYCAQY